MAKRKKSSASTLNIIINALKFYYVDILKKNFIYEVKQPKNNKKIPVVLSKEGVMEILNVHSNIKHKAILMLIYSAGLRIEKVVKLKHEDIDSHKGLIHIKSCK